MNTLIGILSSFPHDSMAGAALKASLVTGLVLLALPMMRGFSAAMRHLLLASLFGLLLFLPLVSRVASGKDITVRQATPQRQVVAGSARPGMAPEHPATQAASPLLARGTATLSMREIVPVVYLGGLLLVLSSLLFSLLQLRRLRLQGRQVAIPERIVPQLPRSARTAEVVVCDDLIVPATYGVFRPVVLLPRECSRWSDEEWQAVLLHESAHIERNDWLVQIMAGLSLAMYWWNPLVWIALSRLKLEAEQSSDDAVLRTTSAVETYAEQLVSLARRTQSRRGLAAVAVARRGTLRKRVQAILDVDRERSARSRSGAVAASLLAFGLVIAVAPLQVVRASETGTANSGRFDNGSDNRSDDENSIGENFYRAAETGRIEVIRTLLDQGLSPDTVSEGDGTPLIGAIRGGNFDIVNLLLDRGAHPDTVASGDGSPLIAAAIAGDVPSAKLLISRGATVDLVVPGDENPLINAARVGKAEMVRYLISAGANVNARVWIEPDQDRPEGEMRTPLFMAMRGGHKEVADILRAAGARLEGSPAALPVAQSDHASN